LNQQRILVMDEAAVRRAIARMAAEIVERNEGVQGLTMMGVQRRGVQLAALLAAEIQASEEVPVPRGSIDITFYRDDLMTIGPPPAAWTPPPRAWGRSSSGRRGRR
jgi:pyrimidine operon attenuation protein / uracil phosphoribosyltransferase